MGGNDSEHSQDHAQAYSGPFLRKKKLPVPENPYIKSLTTSLYRAKKFFRGEAAAENFFVGDCQLCCKSPGNALKNHFW